MLVLSTYVVIIMLSVVAHVVQSRHECYVPSRNLSELQKSFPGWFVQGDNWVACEHDIMFGHFNVNVFHVSGLQLRLNIML